MRKVALAITGLLLALGGGAHGKTMPAQGPSPWCDGHAELPTGNAVTASAGVERGRYATGVFVCVEVAGSGSRPATAEVVRAWADPDEAQVAVECVAHHDARVARPCYKRADTPADDQRKAADDQRKAHGVDQEAPEPPSGSPDAAPPCEEPCLAADEVVAQIQSIPAAVAEEVGENDPAR